MLLIAQPGTSPSIIKICQGKGISWWQPATLIICVEFRKIDWSDLIIYVEFKNIDGWELEGLVSDADLVISESPSS